MAARKKSSSGAAPKFKVLEQGDEGLASEIYVPIGTLTRDQYEMLSDCPRESPTLIERDDSGFPLAKKLVKLGLLQKGQKFLDGSKDFFRCSKRGEQIRKRYTR